MKTYALAPATIQRELRRGFIRFQAVTTALLLFLAGYLLTDRPLRWLVGLPIFVIVLAIYAWITWIHFRGERRYLNSLRVDLTARDLRLYALNQPPAVVCQEDVFAVQETKKGLYISTYDYRSLTAPFGLDEDGDEQVRRVLSTWTWVRPIPPYRYLSDWPLVIGFLASMTVLALVNSLPTALVVGGVLGAYYIYVVLRVRWVSTADPAVFRSYAMALSFMIFIIVMKLCLLIPIAAMP